MGNSAPLPVASGANRAFGRGFGPTETLHFAYRELQSLKKALIFPCLCSLRGRYLWSRECVSSLSKLIGEGHLECKSK